MSKRSDRAAERKAAERAVEQAEKDLRQAGVATRKAFDLKDPRFLGEAAVAATRGPAGLALFGASRGIQVLRERRAEQAQLLGDLAADAKQHAEALREQTSVLAAPQEKKSPLRRFAPLWIAGLAGGAAVAGATAYFLRDTGSAAAGTPDQDITAEAAKSEGAPAEVATAEGAKAEGAAASSTEAAEGSADSSATQSTEGE